jgi:hypothetical protein
MALHWTVGVVRELQYNLRIACDSSHVSFSDLLIFI